MERYDAVVVGGGPNGLSAAIRMAQAGRSVLLLEANDSVGGAAQSAELTLPGFVHDPFSAVYPLGIASPFFRSLPLGEHGLEWVHPEVPLAHPFDDGTAAVMHRSLDATAAALGDGGGGYRLLLEPAVQHWEELVRSVVSPVRIPRHPLLLARFGARGVWSMAAVGKRLLGGGRAAALLGGSAAHTGLPLDFAATAAYGLLLNAAGHAVGWPIPRGGAARIPEALAAHLRSLGGEIRTGVRVRSLADVPPARCLLLSLTPRQLLEVLGERLPPGYRRQLSGYRYGAGVFKVDWALSGPIPWTASGCAGAGTVHLVGSFAELLESERQPWRGEHPSRPFVLLAQPTVSDPTRAPEGKHIAWAYCHVPNGSTRDLTRAVEAQVERFAPGFRDLILARSTLNSQELEARDANLVGGDVNGGAANLGQLFFRPAYRLNPYSTPLEGVFLCSASTPPGGAVHGMCGFNAAEAALREGY